MNIILLGSPFQTAQVLTKEELEQQIRDAKKCLKMIISNDLSHPCVRMHYPHTKWLSYYTYCMSTYQKGNNVSNKVSKIYSDYAMMCKPEWHTPWYEDHWRSRLFNPEQFDIYLDPDTGEWVAYRNGKHIDNSTECDKSGKISLLSRLVEKVKRFIDKTAERL